MGWLESAVSGVPGELESVRRERERSRELLEAARRLALEAAPSTTEARAVLHAEGARCALRAVLGVPVDAPLPFILQLAAGRPGLVAPSDAALLASPTDASALEALHARLLIEAEREVSKLRALELKRWRLTGAAALAMSLLVVLGSWGLLALSRPANLARGKPWRTSSVGLTCEPEKHKCGGLRTDIFFHTHNEVEPWFELDLEAPTAFSSLTVQNRLDMGVARASPLVAEVSDDRVSWKEVARRNEPFTTWEPHFPAVTNRYLRLRVLKKTWLHLEAVEVHP